jgi:hypothetical protein
VAGPDKPGRPERRRRAFLTSVSYERFLRAFLIGDPEKLAHLSGRLMAATARTRRDLSQSRRLGGFLKCSLTTAAYPSADARPLSGTIPALDTLEPPATTVLLSAEEAKAQLREIVEGFFLRHFGGHSRSPRRL